MLTGLIRRERVSCWKSALPEKTPLEGEAALSFSAVRIRCWYPASSRALHSTFAHPCGGFSSCSCSVPSADTASSRHSGGPKAERDERGPTAHRLGMRHGHWSPLVPQTRSLQHGPSCSPAASSAWFPIAIPVLGVPCSLHHPRLVVCPSAPAALATRCKRSCNILCPAQSRSDCRPSDHSIWLLICAPAPSLSVQPGEREFSPLDPFFLSFCAGLPLFSAAPDVKGSGRGEIKKPLKQMNARRLPGPSVHTASRLPHCCVWSEQRQGCVSRGWTLHSRAPHNRPSCSPRQSPACTAIKASISLWELGLAHPSRSPQQVFPSVQLVRTPSHAWRTPAEPPALLSPGTARRPRAGPA